MCYLFIIYITISNILKTGVYSLWKLDSECFNVYSVLENIIILKIFNAGKSLHIPWWRYSKIYENLGIKLNVKHLFNDRQGNFQIHFTFLNLL